MLGYGKQVLVVDDDQDIGCFLVELLERHHFAAVAVADGLEAVRVLHQRHFDAVITDLQMPFLDGLDLIRHCHQRWPELPVILMSANLGDVVGPAMAMGASACLSKPIDMGKLIDELCQALSHEVAFRPGQECVIPHRLDGEGPGSMASADRAALGGLTPHAENQ